MKFIQIKDQPVEPGGLVQWSPYTPGGFSNWTPDGRSTSHNHELHLRSSLQYRWRTKREGGRESWLGLAIEFDEPMSVPALRSALTQWIDRHEVLRSHVVLKHTGMARLSTPPGSVQLKMGRIGWYTESGPLLDQIAGSFDRATAPLQWPAYQFATVARAQSFTLFFAGDHSLLDGYSLILAQYELVELYHAARERRAPQLAPAGSYIDFSDTERAIADDADTSHEAVRAWSAYLESHDHQMPRFALGTAAPIVDADPDESTPPQSSVTIDLLDDDAAHRFSAVCAAAGATLSAGVYAALALAYRTCGGGVFSVITPRHTRDEGRWLSALGWFVSITPVTIDLEGTASFDQMIARAQSALKRGRAAASLPFLRVAEILGYACEPKFVVSFIDTRSAPRSTEADVGGARVLRSHSYSSDEVFIWINRTPSGIRISARFPPSGPQHADVSRFLVAFGDVMRSVGNRSTFGTPHHPQTDQSLGALG